MNQVEPPRWSSGKSGMIVAFIWGLSEGTFFFIVPDIIISLTVIYCIKDSLKQMALVVAGSLLAGSIMFSWAQQDYSKAVGTVRQVPFVNEQMFETCRQDFDEVGVWALCKGPLSGVPYKAYAVEAPAFVPLHLFLLVSIPARLERLLVTWTMFLILSFLIKRFMNQHSNKLLSIHCLYWIAIYAWYWKTI